MKISSATTDLSNTHDKKHAVNRRATFMLGIGSVIGLATQSSHARAESRATNGDGAMPAATTDAGNSGNPKAASASQFQNLKAIGPDRQVASIHHNRNAVEIVTADGRRAVYADADLRIKIDASDKGPSAGRPVILPGGMMGDRATIIFASPAEISALIKQRS